MHYSRYALQSEAHQSLKIVKGKGNSLCTTPAFPMQKMDDIVLSTLADKVFTADRVQIMMQEMRQKQHDSQKNQTTKLKPLQKELDTLKQNSERLFEAVEKGYLPMDETLQHRSHKLQARLQDILLEIAPKRLILKRAVLLGISLNTSLRTLMVLVWITI